MVTKKTEVSVDDLVGGGLALPSQGGPARPAGGPVPRPPVGESARPIMTNRPAVRKVFQRRIVRRPVPRSLGGVGFCLNNIGDSAHNHRPSS